MSQLSHSNCSSGGGGMAKGRSSVAGILSQPTSIGKAAQNYRLVGTYGSSLRQIQKIYIIGMK
jgi:hypothetical protein